MASFDQFIDESTGREHWATYLRSRRYKLSDLCTESVPQTAAWCNACNEVVAAEHLLTQDDIERERGALAAIVRGENSELSSYYKDVDAASIKLKQRERFWAAMAGRRSPPRCLCCFGVDLILLPTGLSDAICIPNGPQLRYDTFGFADCGPECTSLLDTEGRLIHDGG